MSTRHPLPRRCGRLLATLALTGATAATAAPIDGDPVYRGRRSLGIVARSLLEAPAGQALTVGADLPRNPELDIRLSRLTPEVLERAIASGLRVIDADLEHARIFGICSGECLAELAAMPEVTAIHPNYGATTMAGNVVSQADVSIRAAQARQVYGVDGSGIRIGILSDTFTSRTAGNFAGVGCERRFTSSSASSAAELPEFVHIIAEPKDLPGGGGSPTSDEGRAMAELIHDLAPGADLYYHTAFTTPSIFVQGIEALVDCGVDIIVDDVIYFVEPMFQDGIIAQAAAAAIDAGVMFFSAIGNLGPWGVDETYSDFSPLDDMESTPSGNDLHVFGNGTRFAEFKVPRGCALRMVMQWNEPFSGTLGGGATTDLDIYACSSPDPSDCDSSTASRNAQGCSIGGGPAGDPVEILDVVPAGFTDRTAYLAVEHVCGNKNVRFRIASFALSCLLPNRFEFDSSVFRASPVYGHPVGDGVIGTAAVFYQEIDTDGDFQPPSAVINVEPFSSLGGDIPFYFDAAGEPLPRAPHLRSTPLLSAPDGTNTSFFGLRDVEGDGYLNFFGTSAAAPHAAAVAALVLQADPNLSTDEVLEVMRATAIDIEEPGPDLRSGSGLLDALAALDRILATETPTASPSPSASATETERPTPPPSPTRAAGCTGDCDGDGMVTISELVTGVRIALQLAEPDDCPSVDANGDGTVTVNELIQAVLAALLGCSN